MCAVWLFSVRTWLIELSFNADFIQNNTLLITHQTDSELTNIMDKHLIKPPLKRSRTVPLSSPLHSTWSCPKLPDPTVLWIPRDKL